MHLQMHNTPCMYLHLLQWQQRAAGFAFAKPFVSMMASDQHSQVLKTPASAPTMSQSSQLPSGFFLTQITLRILALAFTVAAISTMVTSGQSVFVYGVVFQARFSYSFAFRYKVGVDAAVCALSLLSLILVCTMSRSKSNPSSHFFLFLHDLVLLVLTISGCAAATAIGYVGRFGQNETGWMPICGKLGKFCDRVMHSVILSILAFFCFLVLIIMAANRLKYHP